MKDVDAFWNPELVRDETALDKVLAAYRDAFGVKSERANEIHRDACIDVARLRQIERAAGHGTICSKCDSVYVLLNTDVLVCAMCGSTSRKSHIKK